MQEAQKIEIVSAKSAPLLLVSTILDDQKKETDSLVLETKPRVPGWATNHTCGSFITAWSGSQSPYIHLFPNLKHEEGDLSSVVLIDS